MKNIVKVYWQPGCSSCLKTKEFLIANKVQFKSINILENPDGFKDLQKFGLRMVPIVIKGNQWANGAVFRDVAKVVGFNYKDHIILDPEIIFNKIIKINEATCSYLKQIPDDKLDVLLPGRPRSYRQLVYHVFNIPEVFLDLIESDVPYTYEALLSILPKEVITKKDLLNYGIEIQCRFKEWWVSKGVKIDFSKPAKVYYGKVIFHEVLERTGWHTGQHCRQIKLMLEEKLHINPISPIDESVFEDLPMPKSIWDNERSFAEDSYQGKALESLKHFEEL